MGLYGNDIIKFMSNNENKDIVKESNLEVALESINLAYETFLNEYTNVLIEDVVLEGKISEGFKNAWEKIKAFFRKIKDMITGAFSKKIDKDVEEKGKEIKENISKATTVSVKKKETKEKRSIEVKRFIFDNAKYKDYSMNVKEFYDELDKILSEAVNDNADDFDDKIKRMEEKSTKIRSILDSMKINIANAGNTDNIVKVENITVSYDNFSQYLTDLQKDYDKADDINNVIKNNYEWCVSFLKTVESNLKQAETWLDNIGKGFDANLKAKIKYDKTDDEFEYMKAKYKEEYDKVKYNTNERKSDMAKTKLVLRTSKELVSLLGDLSKILLSNKNQMKHTYNYIDAYYKKTCEAFLDM